MQVTREDISPCLVSFEIQLDPEQYVSALARARKDIGKRTEVPGFRKGKAPEAVLERVLDPERVENLAGELLMPDAVKEVLDEHDLDPWDSPSVEVLEASPESGFKFRTRVPLSPKVELGQYVGLEVDRIVRPVTDEVIDREIERLRAQHTTLEARQEGVVEESDYIFVSIQELDENGEPQGDPAHNSAVVGENISDFDEAVRGMAKDETKDFTINYPEDWGEPERAGKSVRARVTVSHIYRQAKPELNDEFAKTAGGQDTLEALREEIRKGAERAFQQMAHEQVENDLVRKIVENATVDYPPEMMQHEFGHRVGDLFQDLQQRKMSFEDYLQQTSRTEEQFRSDLEQRIDMDLRVGLVMSEVGRKEDIHVEESDIDAEVQAILASDASEQVRERADSPEGRSAIARRLLLRKTLEFLRSASNIKDVACTLDTEAQEAKEA